MKALIIVALFALISCDEDDPPELSEETTFVCPDKKVKIGEDVCAIASAQSGTTSIPYTFYIKKKCGKNEYCLPKQSQYNKDIPNSIKDVIDDPYDYIFTCQKKLKLLKTGKKCNYNAECYTGFCSNGKCSTSDTCNYHKDPICGPSKYCAQVDGKYKCTAFTEENKACTDDDECAPGYNCFGTSSKTCKKVFSLDLGETTSDDEFCKSLTEYNNKCIEVVKVASDCSLTYKDKDGGDEKTLKASDYPDLVKGTNDDGSKKCKFEVINKDLLNNLLKRFNKIKLNKILEKENCGYGVDALCDEKFAELFAVLENYDVLLARGLIKENGEKNKSKKCEYNFWKSVTLSSDYANYCFGLAFALLGLLF